MYCNMFILYASLKRVKSVGLKIAYKYKKLVIVNNRRADIKKELLTLYANKLASMLVINLHILHFKFCQKKSLDVPALFHPSEKDYFINKIIPPRLTATHPLIFGVERDTALSLSLCTFLFRSILSHYCWLQFSCTYFISVYLFIIKTYITYYSNQWLKV